MGGGYPPSVKIINFLRCSEHVQNALKHEIKQYIFFCFFWLEKLIIFTDGGYLPPPFAENSTKIISLIFEPFPKSILLYLGLSWSILDYLGLSMIFGKCLKLDN